MLCAQYDALLWTAPEVLRQMDEHPTMKPVHTPKADIYSFAIILHEILTRKGPFAILDPQNDMYMQGRGTRLDRHSSQ